MKFRAVFESHRGRRAVKLDHYFPIYDRHFERFVGTPVKFLEIGAGGGGSAQLWKRYFGPTATIVSADIKQLARRFEEDQIHVRVGDQSDTTFLASLVEEFGAFDAVLDDGSHIMEHLAKTFNFLYPRIAADGVYMVEDLHTAYWDEYGGGLGREGTFVELCKPMIDQLYAHDIRDPHFVRTQFADITLSIHFYQSVVVFDRGHPAPRKRVRMDKTKDARLPTSQD